MKTMHLIGRDSEKNLIRTFLQTGKHVLLEGPVGVGKTTLALTVAESLSKKVIRVDGDGRFTEQKLVGSFDPKLVLDRGFSKESFIPGPLYQAMEEGAILLMNEMNRMPEMVQNVLLPALDEKKIQIPVLGELVAKPGFCVIATQNPREFVATSPLSEALLDRLEWISISYLSEKEEEQIVTGHLEAGQKSGHLKAVIKQAVLLTRLTREHAKIKRGASIRAAISLVQVLAAEASAPSDEKFWEVAKSVFANRIELQVGKFSKQSYSVLLDELFEELKVELKKKSNA
jgi:gas vesicle protein GvpN